MKISANWQMILLFVINGIIICYPRTEKPHYRYHLTYEQMNSILLQIPQYDTISVYNEDHNLIHFYDY